jgi:cyclophilin family peptidyl-prolyl cis-trans isomerase
LDPNYSLFGQVVKGLEVVEAMQNVETVEDRPVVDVVIKSVTVTVAD